MSALDIIKWHFELISSKLLNKYVAITVGSAIIVIGTTKLYLKRQRKLKRQSYPPNTVILHQFPRGYRAPSASPYVLKLETWLRMANIKYQNEHGYSFGPKGKLPYITYNGEDVADSDFSIQYLAKVFDKDLSKGFSLKDQGCARAFSKMTEESLVWCLALQRFVYGREPDRVGLPNLILCLMASTVRKRADAQGYGRHSKEEVYSIGRKDLKSMNDFLDGKKYLLGETPCNEDAALFGMLCQFFYHETGPLHQFIRNECPNIVAYVENLKSTYWPDWDDCIKQKKN